eukprot:1184147-Prorocentrum_minimum.AAC.2
MCGLPDLCVHHSDNRVHLLPQAGMRIVGEEAAQTVYDHLHALVGAEFADSFECTPSREHIRTIEGREEGFYAWIAANWLIDTNRKTEGGSDKINAGEGPVGIIDLGGTCPWSSLARPKCSGRLLAPSGGSTQAVGLFDGPKDQPGLIKTDNDGALQALNEALYSKSYLGLGAKVRHLCTALNC